MITEEKKIGYLTDAAGAPSSKRLCGSILIGSGIAMGIVIFIMGLIHREASFNASFLVCQWFVTIGAGLLGLGILENTGIKKGDAE